MDQLTIVDHTEWWITYENRVHPEEHGIWYKAGSEAAARRQLESLRGRHSDGSFEVQKITVHRTAKKLD